MSSAKISHRCPIALESGLSNGMKIGACIGEYRLPVWSKNGKSEPDPVDEEYDTKRIPSRELRAQGSGTRRKPGTVDEATGWDWSCSLDE